MKKAMFLAIVVVFAFALGMFMVTGSDATVVGSNHDLSVGDKGDTGTAQVCVYCHHPHRSDSPWTNEVLWNQTAPASPVATYNGGTISTGGSSEELRSILCLSCHDGTIGKDALITMPGDVGNNVGADVTVSATLGTDLTNDHPVNITLTINAGYNDKSAVGPVLTLYGSGADSIQCATCHDVHEGAVNSGRQFMRLAGWAENSAICTTCHVK